MELSIKVGRRREKLMAKPGKAWDREHIEHNSFGRPIRKYSRRGKPQDMNKSKAKAHTVQGKKR